MKIMVQLFIALIISTMYGLSISATDPKIKVNLKPNATGLETIGYETQSFNIRDAESEKDYSAKLDLECKVSIDRHRFVRVVIPPYVNLVNGANVNDILFKAAQFAHEYCESRHGYNHLRVNVFKEGNNTLLIEASNMATNLAWSIHRNVEKQIAEQRARELEQQRRRAAEEKKKRQEELEKRRIGAIIETESCRQFSGFAEEYGVKKMVRIRDLDINPFIYKDTRVAICASFEEMVSPNEALFVSEGNPFYVSNVPPEKFDKKYYALLACSIVGKNSFPCLE